MQAVGIFDHEDQRALFLVVIKYIGAKSEHIRTGSCQKAGPPK